MYVVLSYDIGTKRIKKALAICRKYLKHVHKSVFEGDLTDAEPHRLERELKLAVDASHDSIVVYRIAAPKFVKKDQLGIVDEQGEII